VHDTDKGVLNTTESGARRQRQGSPKLQHLKREASWLPPPVRSSRLLVAPLVCPGGAALRSLLAAVPCARPPPSGLQTPPGTPYRAWRPSGVAQGLQTPPDTPYHAWRPSGVAHRAPALWPTQAQRNQSARRRVCAAEQPLCSLRARRSPRALAADRDGFPTDASAILGRGHQQDFGQCFADRRTASRQPLAACAACSVGRGRAARGSVAKDGGSNHVCQHIVALFHTRYRRVCGTFLLPPGPTAARDAEYPDQILSFQPRSASIKTRLRLMRVARLIRHQTSSDASSAIDSPTVCDIKQCCRCHFVESCTEDGWGSDSPLFCWLVGPLVRRKRRPNDHRGQLDRACQQSRFEGE
jgi:hypothetical protein